MHFSERMKLQFGKERRTLLCILKLFTNLDPRALLLTEGEKSSGEPRNKVSSHWFFVKNNQKRL